MSEQTGYTDEPLLIGERVKDFLPLSGELIKREATVKSYYWIDAGESRRKAAYN